MEGSLKIKNYEILREKDLDSQSFYILSFDDKTHLKVSHTAMHIIKLLDGTHTKDEIIYLLKLESINVTMKDLNYFIEKFLIPRKVLCGQTIKNKEGNKKHNLWFHMPLIESKKLSFIYDLTKHLINKQVSIIMVIIIVLCLAFSVYEILSFNGIIYNAVNSVLILILVYLSMFIHEIGHASAAYKYDIQVGKIGIGIYLMYFVFFVDMTNTWRLEKSKRIINDICGMYFQLIMIIPLYTYYIFTKDVSILCAILMIVVATLMNLFPFLRMDGYWLLSDYLNIQNIQVKAFESIKSLKQAWMIKRNKQAAGEHYEISKTTTAYGLYSLVYVIATAIVVMFITYSVIYLVLDWHGFIFKFESLYNNFVNLDIGNFLLDLNNLFVLCIPVIFLAGSCISLTRKIYMHVKVRSLKK